MASSIAVANRFIEHALEKGDPLTPMKLLKLVYIAHGWMLGLHSRPLTHERVEAWQYGPVMPTLYAHVRDYKGAPIRKKLSSLFAKDQLDEEEQNIIDQVWGAYGHYTAMQLSRMTHAKGTPWALTYEPGSFSYIIPGDLIEDHYRQLAERQAG